MTDEPTYHTIGIGAGPADVSLAALFEAATTERIALFDRQPGRRAARADFLNCRR